MSVCRECCVLSVRGLCDGLITRPEEFYRGCVSLSIIRFNNNPSTATIRRETEVKLRKEAKLANPDPVRSSGRVRIAPFYRPATPDLQISVHHWSGYVYDPYSSQISHA
jgi:hypothetical protein